MSDGQPPPDSFWGGIPEDPATEPDLAPTEASSNYVIEDSGRTWEPLI